MTKTALITGATGGLGKEFSGIFAREGYDLVLVSKTKSKLDLLKEQLQAEYGIYAEIYPVDLAKKDAARDLFDFTAAKGIAVDVLVNNAGFGDFGQYRNCDWNKQYDMMQVNMCTLAQFTRLYLPSMVERRRGRILNVASVAGFFPGPLMSVYYATKAFVLSFTQALFVELKNTGVSVTALCPGPTKTGFEDNADLETSGLFKHLKVDRAKDVAEYGYRQLMRKKVVAVPGITNKLMTFSPRLSPRKLVRECVYLIQK